MPQVNVNTCAGEGIVRIKTDESGKMVVAFTITKNHLMLSLFSDVVLPLSYLYLWHEVPNLATLLVLLQAKAAKAAIVLSISSFINCYGYGFM